MTTFQAVLQKFGSKGEKTGWTYIDISTDIIQEINPTCKTSFRVKGFLDKFPITQVALIPMGDGNFIMAINAEMRKAIRKEKGAIIAISIEKDESELEISEDLLMCLEDDLIAKTAFEKMPKSHQYYYSNWIESAKTITTKSKRISQTIQSLTMGMNYGEMIRYFRDLK